MRCYRMLCVVSTLSSATFLLAMEYNVSDKDYQGKKEIDGDITLRCQEGEAQVPRSLITISNMYTKSLKLDTECNEIYCPDISIDEIILLIPLCTLLELGDIKTLNERLIVYTKSQLLTLSKIADYLDIPRLIQPLSQVLARIMKKPEELATFHEDEEYDSALLHPDIQQAIAHVLLNDNPLKRKMVEGRELLYYVAKRGSNSILSASWSPDSNYIALQSSSGIYIEDAVAHKGLNSFVPETRSILSMKWFADSDNVAILDSKQTIYKWNVHSNLLTTCCVLKNSMSIGSANWSADNRYIAMRLIDNTIVIADTNTGACLHEFTEYRQEKINEIRWSPNGNYIAFSSYNAIYIWETKTWNLIKTLNGHKNMIYSFEWNNNGSYIASGGCYGKVCIWETSTWRRVHVLPYKLGINSMSWNHTGDYLAVVLLDSSVYVSDVNTGKKSYTLSHKNWVNQVHWSPDGTAILIILPRYYVCLWDVKNIYACDSLHLEHVLFLELLTHKKNEKNNGKLFYGKKNNDYFCALFESLPFALRKILMGSSLGLSGILKEMNIISPDTTPLYITNQK